MVETNDITPDYEIRVVRRNAYAATENKVVSSKWAAYPGLILADVGETVGWKVYDSKDLKFRLDDLNNLFVPGSFAQKGKEAAATIRQDLEHGYYEYRLFWGNDEVQGGSAPGVIID